MCFHCSLNYTPLVLGPYQDCIVDWEPGSKIIIIKRSRKQLLYNDIIVVNYLGESSKPLMIYINHLTFQFLGIKIFDSFYCECLRSTDDDIVFVWVRIQHIWLSVLKENVMKQHDTQISCLTSISMCVCGSWEIQMNLIHTLLVETLKLLTLWYVVGNELLSANPVQPFIMESEVTLTEIVSLPLI